MSKWMEKAWRTASRVQAFLGNPHVRMVRATASYFIAILICFCATWPLAHIAIYWTQWLRSKGFGIFDYFPFVIVNTLCFVASLAVALSPMSGWIRKWLQGDWRDCDFAPGEVGVYVDDGQAKRKEFASSVRRGKLRFTDGSLVIDAGERKWTIQATQLMGLDAMPGFAEFPIMESGRIRTHTSMLSWLDEDGIAHQVSIVSRAGGSAWADRKLDKRIYRALCEWRDGAESRGFEGLRAARWRPRVVFALAFVLLSLSLPALSNYLIRTRWNTWRWLPPARTIAKEDMGWPVVRGLAPIDPRRMFTSGPERIGGRFGQIWIGDFESGRIRFLGENSFLFSHPWKPTHVYQDVLKSFAMDAQFSPFRPDSDLILPSRIGSLESLQAVGVPIYEVDPYRTALYKNERVFYWWTEDDQTLPFTMMMEWLDVASGEYHSLPPIAVPKLGQYQMIIPVFFPSGLHLLLHGHVIDLDTGDSVKVAWPEDFDEKLGFQFSWTGSIFPAGDRLRFYPLQESGRYSKDPVENFNYVLELDPETASAEIIHRFAKGERLVCADGDRWLISAPIEESRDLQISLFDFSTRRRRELLQAPGLESRYFLVEGEDRLMSYVDEQGWSMHDFPEAP